MESLTKPRVTPEQIEEIAKKHFGERPAAVRELTAGWFNAAFLLTQPGGAEYVLKIAPPQSARLLRYEKDIMKAEVDSMRLVRTRTDVPVPDIVVFDRDRNEVGSEYFIMERLDGRPYDLIREGLEPTIRDSIDRQIGAELKKMHALTGDGFGVFNKPEHSNWKSAFRTMFEDLHKDAEDLKVDLPPRVFEVGEPLFPSLDVVHIATFVHWDLWDGNVFVRDGKVTGFIDFERSMWGDPLIEVNFFDHRPGLVDGYGEDLRSSALAVERRMLYDLYFFLIMIIESTSRGYTAEHEVWPRQQLAALMERIGTAKL